MTDDVSDWSGRSAPLAGIRLALTADRRAAELIAAFERRGADVLHAPTLRILPMADADALLSATRRLLDQPPDVVLVTTAIGLRTWLESAEAAGLGADLLRTLSGTRLLPRGPKARGALRAAGLSEDPGTPPEAQTTAELVHHLLDEAGPQSLHGVRVAVQEDGAGPSPLLEQLRAAGAQVWAVPVYRWGPTDLPGSVRRAVEATARRELEAVVFTSAPGASAFLAAAQALDRREQVLQALREGVLAAVVGPVTAAPLRQEGVATVMPQRHRIGALIRTVTLELAGRGVIEVVTAAGTVVISGDSVSVDGDPVRVSAGPAAMLRALARHPGAVLDRSELLRALPGAQDPHAVEVAVARLRQSLGQPGIVQTVVKRGYRLHTLEADD